MSIFLYSVAYCSNLRVTEHINSNNPLSILKHLREQRVTTDIVVFELDGNEVHVDEFMAEATTFANRNRRVD